MRNRGISAYKPDIYQDRITIERKIVRDGPNTYKVYDSLGRVVSTKREEVENITDFWNIQVDNPLCILNQDVARQFLQESSEKQRYAFFMKATYLDQLKEQYTQIEELIQKMDAQFDLKKRVNTSRLYHLELGDSSRQEEGHGRIVPTHGSN
jgi:chromosome segregation ATPase